MTTETRPLVAGLGGRWNGDDGVGAAVAAELRSVLRDVDVVEVPGPPRRLTELWDGRPLAVVVAATRSGGPRGRVRRVEFPPDSATAPHPDEFAGLDAFPTELVATCRRAVAEGTAPARLVLFGVEAGPVYEGLGLSLLVAAAVPAVVRAVRAEVATFATI